MVIVYNFKIDLHISFKLLEEYIGFLELVLFNLAFEVLQWLTLKLFP